MCRSQTTAECSGVFQKPRLLQVDVLSSGPLTGPQKPPQNRLGSVQESRRARNTLSRTSEFITGVNTTPGRQKLKMNLYRAFEITSFLVPWPHEDRLNPGVRVRLEAS